MKKRVDAGDYSEWKNTIGVAIRRRREQLKQSIENAATSAEISPELLHSIENGSGHLTLQQLYRLSRTLDVPMSQLLLGTEPAPATGDVGEFMDAFRRLKDPELKDQIFSLVSTMVDRLPGDIPKN